MELETEENASSRRMFLIFVVSICVLIVIAFGELMHQVNKYREYPVDGEKIVAGVHQSVYGLRANESRPSLCYLVAGTLLRVMQGHLTMDGGYAALRVEEEQMKVTEENQRTVPVFRSIRPCERMEKIAFYNLPNELEHGRMKLEWKLMRHVSRDASLADAEKWRAARPQRAGYATILQRAIDIELTMLGE